MPTPARVGNWLSVRPRPGGDGAGSGGGGMVRARRLLRLAASHGGRGVGVRPGRPARPATCPTPRRPVRGGPRAGGVGRRRVQAPPELLRNTVEVVTGVCETRPGGGGRPRRHGARRPAYGRRARRRPLLGRHPPVRAVVGPAAHARPPLRGADLAHPVVGAADADLGPARPRRASAPQEHVLPIVSSLLNQFPHLQALSASSPVWSGTDTGYASNRAMMFQQLPTAGLPFQFQTWEEYEGYVARRASHRCDRAHQRHPLGHPTLTRARHRRGAGLRRRLEPARARRRSPRSPTAWSSTSNAAWRRGRRCR